MYSGTYNENLVINIRLNIIGISNEFENGNDVGRPVIVSSSDSGNDNPIVINADNCEFTNFKMIYLDFIHSGFIVNSNYNLISNNSLNNFFLGIVIQPDSHDNKISFNKIYNSTNQAIELIDTKYNTIDNNTIVNSNVYGISLYLEGNHNTIIDNDISDCGYEGIYICWNCSNNKIIGNFIEECNNGIKICGESRNTNNIIEHNWCYDNEKVGLYLSELRNDNINNNHISNNNIGIFVCDFCRDLTISNNLIYENNIGISLKQVSDNEIKENSIRDCLLSVEVLLSNQNNFEDNNFFCAINTHLINSLQNTWEGNYWADHPTSWPPKVIFGRFYYFFPIELLAIPYLNFDREPRNSPN